MIPEPGEERDRLIAEMKGLEPTFACCADEQAPQSCAWDDGELWNCNLALDGVRRENCDCWRKTSDWPPRWSTDLFPAWELWEELPMPKSIDQIRGDHWCVCWGDSFNPDFIGTTFPDAVSAAWIEWKRREEKQ